MSDLKPKSTDDPTSSVPTSHAPHTHRVDEARAAVRNVQPELTWSSSQQRTLDDCPRARYWASEQAPVGRRPAAPELARTACRLKTLTTLDAEAGRTLHERAAERALALREGEPMPSLAVMRQRASARMRYVWISSRDRRADWLRDPKRTPMLIDTYYDRGPSREQALAVRERLERGVITLHQLGLWGELAACDPRDVLVVDSLTSYLLPDPAGGPPVRVWAAPDLVMRIDADALWEVLDYKSGRVRDGRAYREAVAQVASYAVYLRHGARVLGPGEDCRGRLVLLGDGTEAEFAITAAEIDAAEARIRAGARAMAALRARADEAERAVAADGPATRAALAELARRGAYPMTDDRTRCRRCPYLELCAPEQQGQVAADAGSEEVA